MLSIPDKGDKMPTELKKRIEYVRKHFKFKSRNEMAATLGIDNLRMQNLENGRCKNLLIEEALLFKTVLKINPWWMMSGQEQMMLASEKKIETLYTDGELKIKLISPVEGKTHVCLDTAFMPEHTITASHLRALRMHGDSMNPTLNDGDYAIVHLESELINSGIYVLLIDSQFSINRIALRVDHSIEISYDNPSYKSYCVNKNDIKIYGKVILTLSNK